MKKLLTTILTTLTLLALGTPLHASDLIHYDTLVKNFYPSDELQTFYYQGPKDNTFWTNIEPDEYDEIRGTIEDRYQEEIRTTTLGVLACHADAIGMGRVVKQGQSKHSCVVVVERALTGCARGDAITLYETRPYAFMPNPNKFKMDFTPYMPTNESQIVFASFDFYGFRDAWPARLNYTNKFHSASKNFDKISFESDHPNRCWWYLNRDDGEVFKQFTNLYQAARVERNWGKYYKVCKRGLLSKSNRVREDAWWDLYGIVFFATHEQEHIINDDPFLNPKFKTLLFKKNWPDPETRNIKGLPAFQSEECYGFKHLLEYLYHLQRNPEPFLYNFKDATLGEFAKHADIIGVGRVGDPTEAGFTVTVELPLVGCANGESILLNYTNIVVTRRGHDNSISHVPTNNSRIAFAVNESPNNTNGRRTSNLIYTSRRWWDMDDANAVLFDQFTNILQAVRVEQNWTHYYHLCHAGTTSTSLRVREDAYLDMWDAIEFASKEERQALYDEPWPDKNFKDWLYDYILNHDYETMDFWPSCKKSHEIAVLGNEKYLPDEDDDFVIDVQDEKFPKHRFLILEYLFYLFYVIVAGGVITLFWVWRRS